MLILLTKRSNTPMASVHHVNKFNMWFMSRKCDAIMIEIEINGADIAAGQMLAVVVQKIFTCIVKCTYI